MSYRGIKIKVGSTTRDTSFWGLYVTQSPYTPVPLEIKNISSQSWYDENGDDEFIPQVLKYVAIEQDIRFVYKGLLSQSNAKVKSFFDFIKGATFSYFDTHKNIGYANVRLVSISDGTMSYISSSTDEVIIEFIVRVKINNPEQTIVL